MIDSSDVLKKLRKKHNLTIQAVSDGTSIPIRTYQNYEYGKREISAEALFKLADFYHVTTDYLLGRDTTEPDTVEKLVGEFNMSALEKRILEGYLDLPENMRGDLMEFLENAVEEIQGK